MKPQTKLALRYRAALLSGAIGVLKRHLRRGARAAPEALEKPCGISVVIPSRNGKELLDRLLPGLHRELRGFASEVIVTDNGSGDGTVEYLAASWPRVIVEHSPRPLSFARAVNRGIARAAYSRVFLLNNDMILEPDFFGPLMAAFDAVPDLFCATAQILFPAGARREETGKAVMAQNEPTDFPVRCDEPFPGEDLSYVLYGSGGCSLYAAGKLDALGRVSELYEPAYVEDLDLGYRAWQRGWPTVFVAGARLEHRHRATTSRYFSPEELDVILEVNYLKFLASAVASPEVFRRLWGQAVWRLRLLSAAGYPAADRGLRYARRAPFAGIRAPRGSCREDLFLALGSGDVVVYPKAAPGRDRGTVVVAAAYRPLPRQAGSTCVLVAGAEQPGAPEPGALESYAEIVLVRAGNGDAMRAAIRETVHKWRPAVVQMESGMAHFAQDCAPAKVVLI